MLCESSLGSTAGSCIFPVSRDVDFRQNNPLLNSFCLFLDPATEDPNQDRGCHGRRGEATNEYVGLGLSRYMFIRRCHKACIVISTHYFVEQTFIFHGIKHPVLYLLLALSATGLMCNTFTFWSVLTTRLLSWTLFQ